MDSGGVGDLGAADEWETALAEVLEKAAAEVVAEDLAVGKNGYLLNENSCLN